MSTATGSIGPRAVRNSCPETGYFLGIWKIVLRASCEYDKLIVRISKQEA